jgi:hypothetical protein
MGMVFKSIEYMNGVCFQRLYPKVQEKTPPPIPGGMQNYQMIQPFLPSRSAEKKLWQRERERERENWL